MNRKLYLEIENGFNLENPITNKSVDLLQNCTIGDYLTNLLTIVENVKGS